MSRLYIIIFSTLIVLFYSLDSGAHAPGVSLSGFGSATIDGFLTPGEWDGADKINFPVNIPASQGGGTVQGTLYVMNDNTNLYLAVTFPFSASGNTAGFQFDNDNSGGSLADGDDGILRNTTSFFDIVRTTIPPCPSGAICGLFDTTLGGTNDGEGEFSNVGGVTVYEFSHPLDSVDDDNDFSLIPGDTVGFGLSIRLIVPPSNFPADFGDTGFPSALNPNMFGDIIISSQFIPIDIDIKPGNNDFNCINPNSNGNIPVAIFGGIVDLIEIDINSIKIDSDDDPGTIGVSPIKSSYKDVNGDLIDDLIIHFNTPDLYAQEMLLDGNELFITGQTTDSTPIVGSDLIYLAGGPNCSD